MNRYVMKRKVKTRLERSYERTFRCRVCSEELAVGDPVVRSSSMMRPPPFYHERCYEATLTISPTSRRFQKITDFIAKMPYVVSAYHMTGKWCILAIVQVADIDELTKSIQEIQNVDDVLDVEARVALEKIK